ncbi:5137_t:CDS:1, partial [Scutellospora calospora]
NAQLHKRVTNFGLCRTFKPVSLFTTVTLSPDHIVPGNNVNVTLTGKLDRDVPAFSSDVLEVVFLEPKPDPEFPVPIVDPFSIELCIATGITCPILKGTEIHTTVPVPVPDAKVLPEKYLIAVDVREN